MGTTAPIKPFPPVLLTHALFQSPRHPPSHPLSIARSGPFLDILEHLQWINPEQLRIIEPLQRAAQEMFHTPDYLDALEQGAQGVGDPALLRSRHNIGTQDNPILPSMADRARLLAGGSVMAAHLAMSHSIAFSPAGGAHHGMPDRANGFCYTNDPVFAIMTLFELGLSRVAYVDLDAHHADGVEAAFSGDPRVLMISVHERHRWPGTGKADLDNSLNRPVPSGFQDADRFRLLDTDLLPQLQTFKPDAIVILTGADAMAHDPLMRLSLSNRGLVLAINQLMSMAPRRIILGGGGYNPWTVVRYWVMLWASWNGYDIPNQNPSAITSILSSLECARIKREAIQQNWLTSLVDP